jgi:hypothetical protein
LPAGCRTPRPSSIIRAMSGPGASPAEGHEGRGSARAIRRLPSALRRRLQPVRAAGAYTPVADLWVITCYFNPTGYRTKRRNLARFTARLRDSGLGWLVVECARPFPTLPAAQRARVSRGECFETLNTRDGGFPSVTSY